MHALDRLWHPALQTGDRGAIAVLADALVERGDPRGLFVQLMLVGGREALEQAVELLEQHREAWLGAFAELAVRGSDVWRDGVLRGFRPEKGVPWPVPTHADWLGIQQLDLVACGLDPALPVFDEPRVPLRAVFGVGSWEDLETLLCRSSPRTRLEHLSAASCVRSNGRPVQAVQLQVDTLHLVVVQRDHRELPRVVEEGLAIHKQHALRVEVEHPFKGALALHVVLDTEVHATLWPHQGELPVGWAVLKQLADHGVPLRVVGTVTPALGARLEKRSPGWLRWEDPPCPVDVAQTELRSLWGSWQLTRAFTVPTDSRVTGPSGSFVKLEFPHPRLLDGFNSGRSGPLEPDYPPR